MSNINPHSHKRITDILFKHWNKARGERMFPAIQDIDEFAIKQDGIWDDVFIIDVFPMIQSNGYRFSYKGANLNNDYFKDGSGKFVRNIVVGFLESSNTKYDAVFEQKRPIQEEEEYTSPETGVTIKYRQILLPLGASDEGDITSIIGGMRFVSRPTR